jgi:hypothetical protein
MSLVQNVPLSFVRRIPTGALGVRHTGLMVETEIAPDLHVSVALLSSNRVIAEGEYDYQSVRWRGEPSREVPRSSLEILSADVSAMMAMFERRLILPTVWTSHPRATQRL